MLDAHGLDKPAHKGIRLVRHLVAYAPSHFRSRSRQIGVLDREGGYKAPKEAVNLMPGDIGGEWQDR